MKKSIRYILYVAVAVAAVWAFAARMSHQNPATPVVKELKNSSQNIKVDNLKGKYVLVNFWDSHNAVSRIATGEYDRFFRNHRGEGMEMVSVNTDNDRRLFSELAKKDGLDLSRQFNIKDVEGGSFPPNYKPKDGYSSYLLNPEGKIVAYNPSVETLEKYLH